MILSFVSSLLQPFAARSMGCGASASAIPARVDVTAPAELKPARTTIESVTVTMEVYYKLLAPGTSQTGVFTRATIAMAPISEVTEAFLPESCIISAVSSRVCADGSSYDSEMYLLIPLTNYLQDKYPKAQIDVKFIKLDKPDYRIQLNSGTVLCQ